MCHPPLERQEIVKIGTTVGGGHLGFRHQRCVMRACFSISGCIAQCNDVS